MKRDPRLRTLSSEHHHALVLARALTAHDDPWSQIDPAALGRRFDLELEPHFAIEEQLLLPELMEQGQTALVQRTLDDHAFLRAQVRQARTGDNAAAQAFATRLYEHVRFEERELFPACETLLSATTLDQVARRSRA